MANVILINQPRVYSKLYSTGATTVLRYHTRHRSAVWVCPQERLTGASKPPSIVRFGDVINHIFTKVVRVPVLGVSVLRVPVLLASRTLWTGGTQSFRPPRYPGDWRDAVLLPPRYPVDWRDSVLLTPRYSGDCRDSDLSAPQVLCELVGLSPFNSPQGTLGTGGTQSFEPQGILGTGGTQYL